MYEEFRTQKTAKHPPESRLSLLNRDWKSQISEENSVASSPLKTREIPDKIQSGKLHLVEPDLCGIDNRGMKRAKSYHAGDFDEEEALEDVL